MQLMTEVMDNVGNPSRRARWELEARQILGHKFPEQLRPALNTVANPYSRLLSCVTEDITNWNMRHETIK